MSKGMLVLLTCLLACSTITAQFEVIEDEEFEAAVREASVSAVSVTRKILTISCVWSPSSESNGALFVQGKRPLHHRR